MLASIVNVSHLVERLGYPLLFLAVACGVEWRAGAR